MFSIFRLLYLLIIAYFIFEICLSIIIFITYPNLEWRFDAFQRWFGLNLFLFGTFMLLQILHKRNHKV